MKQYSIFFMFLLYCFLFVSCGNKNGDNILRVATNAEYPPFEFKNNSEFLGIDIELARLIAKEMNLKIKISDIDFDGIIPSLISDKIDFAIAAITITEDRKKKVDFSSPYYLTNQAILVKSESNIVIDSIQDLASFSIGSQTGTTGQIYITNKLINKNLMPAENLKKYPTNVEAITNILNGNIDVLIIDELAANGYKKLKPVKIIKIFNTGEEYGIALPKGSKYKSQINQVLSKILKSKEWKEIIGKYI